MKARFVHESVNFERGQDPQEAMGIGRATMMEGKIDMSIKKYIKPLADGDLDFNWDYKDEASDAFKELLVKIPSKNKENRKKIKEYINGNDNYELFQEIYDHIEEEGYQLGMIRAANWGIIPKGIIMYLEVK